MRRELLLRPPLLVRRDACQATVDRYLGRLHVWGKVDCMRVVGFHLKQLGYAISFAPAGHYTNEVGAVRALKRLGFGHPHEALAAHGLKEIGHASALMGDVLSLRSAGRWPAMAVRISNGRVLTSTAEHPTFGLVTPGPDDILTAWRADPCLTR